MLSTYHYVGTFIPFLPSPSAAAAQQPPLRSQRDFEGKESPFADTIPVFPVGAYYESLLHELAHWSEIRVGWDHRTNGYAMCELVAEMASSFLSTELGVPQGETLENHAAYVKSWLFEMLDDSSFIFAASKQASKVADFLLSFVQSESVSQTQVSGV